MAQPANEPPQGGDTDVHAELLRNSQRLLAEAEALMGMLKNRLDDADVIRTTLAEAATSAQAKLGEVTAAATATLLGLTC